jgi:hypothetical protein
MAIVVDRVEGEVEELFSIGRVHFSNSDGSF